MVYMEWMITMHIFYESPKKGVIGIPYETHFVQENRKYLLRVVWMSIFSCYISNPQQGYHSFPHI